MDTIRLKGTISYDGSKFSGFAKQPDASSVQEKIEEAFRLLQTETEIIGSGRTDANVHALRQVFHCDVPYFWKNNFDRLKSSLKRFLLPHIGLRNLEIVDKSFHARFSAKKRSYRYLISTATPNPFFYHYITYARIDHPQKIAEAIELFKGEHDFEYFKKAGSNAKSFKRTIYKTLFYEYKGIYVIGFEANGFLYSQVRMMVDFLLKIANDRLTMIQLKEQIEKKAIHNRDLALPNGLYLYRVYY